MGSIEPFSLALEAVSRPKTIDWGSNGLMISMDQEGTILQFGFYHPLHGVVLLSPFEQFDSDRFYDPAYVRFYRSRMMQLFKSSIPGFGLQIRGHPGYCSKTTIHRDRLTSTYQTQNGIQVQKVTTVSHNGEFQQTTILSTTSSKPLSVPVVLSLKMSLNRASYGQLTEGGPIPLPKTTNIFKSCASGSRFSLYNPHLDAGIEGSFWTNRSDITRLAFENTERSYQKGPVTEELSAIITIMPDFPAVFNLTLHPNVQGLPFQPKSQFSSQLPSSPVWKLQDPAALKIIRGNLDYILGNCMIPISELSTCVITDHVALPLGWNRDNYWQIRFLLEVFQRLDLVVDSCTASDYRKEIGNRVKGHLNWVFHDAERPHAFWHRSYLANGVPKDGAVFQLDQQCYPILELCDYFEMIPDSETSVRAVLEESTISEIIEVLIAKRDPLSKLFPTDETPGDDPVVFPFHFSSHVLVWYMFKRLSELLKRTGNASTLQASSVEELASETLDATISHFVAQNPKTKETMFAYLTDGAGQHTFYHDANDIPTLFAKEWGFANRPEISALWTRTFEFGLSAENEGGYYGDGPFGGLGSVHTRGPWPLGYFQELVFAEMTGNCAARDIAWHKIRGTMFSDGLFSEAVDSFTGECTSKAWFSWPGSMIGSALLRDRLQKVL